MSPHYQVIIDIISITVIIIIIVITIISLNQAWGLLSVFMGLFSLGGEEEKQLHVLLLKVRTEIQNTFEKCKIHLRNTKYWR